MSRVENTEIEHWLKEGLEKGYSLVHLKKILAHHGFEDESEKVVDIYLDMIKAKQEVKKTFSPWLVLIALVFGTILVGLDRTVVNLALPTIIKFFGVTLSTAGWVASVYILTSAIFVPIFGKLGGRYGHRKIFSIGFISFIIMSVAAGFAWNISSLIIFRAIQGIGGAAIYPTAMSLIAKSFRDKKARAQALGIWSAVVASSVAIGPLVGGPLIDSFSWRSAFFVNVPIGIIGIIMLYIFVPKDMPEEIGKFDFLGAVWLGLSITSLVLVLDKGIGWGWLSLYSTLAYISFFLFGAIFLINEIKVSNPVIDLNLFKNRILSSVLVTTLISQGMFTGSLLSLSLFAQKILGYTATKTGYIFLPMVAGFIVFAPLGAKISHKISPRLTIAIGLFISAIGAYLLSGVTSSTTFVGMLPAFILMGSGLGLGMAPITTAATSCVPHSEVGVASGLLNLTRNISGVFGIALITTLLSLGYSFKVLFIITAIFIFVGAIVALLIKESKKDYEGQETSEIEVPAIIEG